jgi:hypothetical protein
MHHYNSTMHSSHQGTASLQITNSMSLDVVLCSLLHVSTCCLRLRLHWSHKRHNTSQDRLQIRKQKSKTLLFMSAATLKPIRLERYLPPTVWHQQSEFVSSRQSGQILTAVRIEFECHWNSQNGCWFKCSHTFLQCIH